MILGGGETRSPERGVASFEIQRAKFCMADAGARGKSRAGFAYFNRRKSGSVGQYRGCCGPRSIPLARERTFLPVDNSAKFTIIQITRRHVPSDRKTSLSNVPRCLSARNDDEASSSVSSLSWMERLSLSLSLSLSLLIR